MNELTWSENLHLADYLELLMDERRERLPRATHARTGSEPRTPRPVEEPHVDMRPCELYAWRYLGL